MAGAGRGGWVETEEGVVGSGAGVDEAVAGTEPEGDDLGAPARQPTMAAARKMAKGKATRTRPTARFLVCGNGRPSKVILNSLPDVSELEGARSL